MPTNSRSIFRSALLIEAAANVGMILPLIIAPETSLSYLTQSSAYITPVAASLTQWLGAVVVLATVPLIISYPEPTASEPPSLVTARRRLTYLSMAASELALGAVTAGQYLRGNSGLKDSVPMGATIMFAGLVGMRAFFLFGKPELMEAKTSLVKSK